MQTRHIFTDAMTGNTVTCTTDQIAATLGTWFDSEPEVQTTLRRLQTALEAGNALSLGDCCAILYIDYEGREIS